MGARKDGSPCWTDSHDHQAGADSSFEFLQQRLSVLQVRRVKSLREPLIYRGQQVIGFLALVLGLPKSSLRCVAPTAASLFIALAAHRRCTQKLFDMRQDQVGLIEPLAMIAIR